MNLRLNLRTTAALLVIAVGAPACGAFLPRIDPKELAALSPAEREPLAAREGEVARLRSALALAARDRDMAAARASAAARKPRITDARLAWIDAEREAARRQQLDARLAELENCGAAEAGLVDVLKSEVAAMDAALAAARGRESELERQLALAEGELERARVAAVYGRRGVSVAERDEAVGKWDLEVSKRRGVAEAALVERRRREVRAVDAEKVWLGLAWSWRGRHGEPCRVDWALPDAERRAPAAPDAGRRALEPLPGAAPPATPAPVPAPAAPAARPVEPPRTSRPIATPPESDVEVFPLR